MGGAGARQRAKTFYPVWGRAPVGPGGGRGGSRVFRIVFGVTVASHWPAQPSPALAYSRDQTFA